MKKPFILLIVLIFLLVCATAGLSAQKQLVSGNLKKLNNYVKIAVNPASGDALVVWSQGNSKKNDYGRLYAAELTRQQDGSYQVGNYFMVSPNSGSHHRPSVVWLPNAGKYLIAWDTSFYDLNEFKKLQTLAQRPFPGAEILARTYTPGSGGEAGLGELLTVNDGNVELNVVPNIIRLELQTATAPLVATDTDRVFITFLGSDESEYSFSPGDGQTLGAGDEFEAGLWGSQWDVSASATSVGTAGVSDISLIARTQMLFWNDDPINICVLAQGFAYHGMLYCAGAYMKLAWEGEDIITGVGMIMSINPGMMSVENYFETGEYNPGSKGAPLGAHGQVMMLDGAVAAPADLQTLIGASNVIPPLMSINSELADSSAKTLGLVSTPGDVLDQRLFALGGIAGAPAKKSDLYVLFYNKTGLFRYRNLAAGTGMPTGAATTVLKIKKRRLKYMDVATFGNEALVAFAEQRNKKNWQVNFFKFTVK